MKRFLCTLLAAVLLVTALGTVAFAAETTGTVKFSAGDDTVEAGQTATLTISVSGGIFSNYSLSSVSVSNSSITISGSSITMNTGSGKAAYAYHEDMENHSFTISFNVPEGTDAGTYPVTINVNRVRNSAGEEQPFTATATGNIFVEKPACEHAWDDGNVTTEATCGEEGVKTYTCKKCGETKTEKIDPTGKHTYKWTVTKAATCTEKGVASGKCSVCGHTTTRDIPAMGHKGGKIVHENNPDQHWYDKCENCGKPYGHEDHSYKGSWIVGEAATETEDGWKYKDCEVCGYRATEKIPAGMDQVAETGDITGQFVMGATAVIVMLFAAVAFVFKRKTAK